VPRERRYLRAPTAADGEGADERGRPLPARCRDGRARRLLRSGDAWIHAAISQRERQRIEPATSRARGVEDAGAGGPPRSRSRAAGYAVGAAQGRLAGLGDHQAAAAGVSGKWWSGDLHVHRTTAGVTATHPAPGGSRPVPRDSISSTTGRQQGAAGSGHRRLPAWSRSGIDGGVLLLHGERSTPAIGATWACSRCGADPAGYTAYLHRRATLGRQHAGGGLAHEQGGVVGYVHRRERHRSVAGRRLTNESCSTPHWAWGLLRGGGFLRSLSTAAVWYRLLDCGLRLPAAPGPTRWPTTLIARARRMNRVYVKAEECSGANRFSPDSRPQDPSPPMAARGVRVGKRPRHCRAPAGATLQYTRGFDPMCHYETRKCSERPVAARHDLNAASAT